VGLLVSRITIAIKGAAKDNPEVYDYPCLGSLLGESRSRDECTHLRRRYALS
jgi:hypothetical protein